MRGFYGCDPDVTSEAVPCPSPVSFLLSLGVFARTQLSEARSQSVLGRRWQAAEKLQRGGTRIAHRSRVRCHLPHLLLVLLLVLLWPVGIVAAAIPEREIQAPGLATRVLLHGDELLVGTERGLYARELGARGAAVTGDWRLLLARGEVRGLAAGPGSVLVATERGLWEWTDEGVKALPLVAGAAVAGVAMAPSGDAWATTDVGLFHRPADAAHFRRSAPPEPVRAEAVVAAGDRVWFASARGIWARNSRGEVEVVHGPVAPGWWELVDAVEQDDRVLLAVPRGLWVLEPETLARPVELRLGELRALAKGGEGDGVWVASDRGVFGPLGDLSAAGLPERTLGTETFDLASAPGGVWAATRAGVARIPATARFAPGRPLVAPPRSPLDVVSVQREVLRYLDLSPASWREVERRARRAGWLPVVRGVVDLASDRSGERERDQVVSSGTLHELHDATRERDRELSIGLQLTWDLMALRAPDHAIAISRERRERIELRDQVLERVTRLYFDRERALAKLAATELQGGAARELELQADELAAQLDAWSGGGFSRIARNRPPHKAHPSLQRRNP